MIPAAANALEDETRAGGRCAFDEERNDQTGRDERADDAKARDLAVGADVGLQHDEQDDGVDDHCLGEHRAPLGGRSRLY